MGSVAGGGGEEEAENLSAVDMLHDIVDSFAKQPSDQREFAEGSQKRHSKGSVGSRIIGRGGWVGSIMK